MSSQNQGFISVYQLPARVPPPPLDQTSNHQFPEWSLLNGFSFVHALGLGLFCRFPNMINLDSTKSQYATSDLSSNPTFDSYYDNTLKYRHRNGRIQNICIKYIAFLPHEFSDGVLASRMNLAPAETIKNISLLVLRQQWGIWNAEELPTHHRNCPLIHHAYLLAYARRHPLEKEEQNPLSETSDYCEYHHTHIRHITCSLLISVAVQRYELSCYFRWIHEPLYIQQLAKLISNQLGRLYRLFGANFDGAAWFLICTSLISYRNKLKMYRLVCIRGEWDQAEPIQDEKIDWKEISMRSGVGWNTPWMYGSSVVTTPRLLV